MGGDCSSLWILEWSWMKKVNAPIGPHFYWRSSHTLLRVHVGPDTLLRVRVGPHTLLRERVRTGFILLANEPCNFETVETETVENPWGSVEKTVPSGEFLGCLHCAAGHCKGSLGIFLGQTLGFKTSGAVPPRFCSLGLAQMPQGPSHGPLAQCEHP